MAKTLDTTIELARFFDQDGSKRVITIAEYNDFVVKKEQDLIADFIFQRLHSRYLKPFQFIEPVFTQQFKNGFSIMANCCLLIETLQSFKNGWGDSDKKSKQAFKQFLTSERNFSSFATKEQEFYINVRCGILHQGETTGGWTIKREGLSLFDSTSLAVDSLVFAKQLEQSLINYCNKLKSENWDSEAWDNCRTKMRRIISNCER